MAKHDEDFYYDIAMKLTLEAGHVTYFFLLYSMLIKVSFTCLLIKSILKYLMRYFSSNLLMNKYYY